eukprot:8659068-Ditylum_brightwellii.AAC.1
MEAVVKYKSREVGRSCCNLKHIGFSTSFHVNCKDGHEYTCEGKKRGGIFMGVGGEEMSSMLTFLDVPHSKQFGKALIDIEDDAGEVIRMVAKTCLKGGLEEEMKLTLEEKYKDWEESETPGE